MRVELNRCGGPDMLKRVGARSHTMAIAFGHVDDSSATERVGMGVKLIDPPWRLSLECQA